MYGPGRLPGLFVWADSGARVSISGAKHVEMETEMENNRFGGHEFAVSGAV